MVSVISFKIILQTSGKATLLMLHLFAFSLVFTCLTQVSKGPDASVNRIRDVQHHKRALISIGIPQKSYPVQYIDYAPNVYEFPLLYLCT